MGNKKRREDRILIIVGIVCLCIFCISGYLLLDYYLESRKQEKLSAQLSRLKHGSQTEGYVEVEAIPIEPTESTRPTLDAEPTKDVDSETEAEQESEETVTLAELNPDYIGWIQMPDTVIDYPLVQRDNAYYLRRDFYGEKNKHGTIFLDESCDTEDSFLLFHGHNMKDGTMFGCLKNLKKEGYREEHREFTISWEPGEEIYEIFAGALIDLYDENRFPYEKLPKEEEKIYTYLEELKIHALWYEDVAWEPGQRVVILSTCDYGTEEQRFMVAAIEKK